MISSFDTARSLSPNPVEDVRRLLEFRFMVSALEAGAVVALCAACVGWFMVLRRESFVGHTLSVMAFPGAAAAALLGLPAGAGYFAFCAAGAGAIGAGGGARGNSALTGTVQAVALAAGFVLLRLYRGVLGDYETLLFGSFLGVTRGQVLLLAVVCVAALAALAAIARPLLLASIDPQIALARGLPVRALGVLFLLILALTVAATAQITGVLLVFALLVAPAAAAREITPRIGAGIALAALLGVAIVWIGLATAYFYDLPIGAPVATLAFAAYALARVGRASRERA
ncbi:MAG: metal ABC transporter permease [Solirubrobacteraceae bacterium]